MEVYIDSEVSTSSSSSSANKLKPRDTPVVRKKKLATLRDKMASTGAWVAVVGVPKRQEVDEGKGG